MYILLTPLSTGSYVTQTFSSPEELITYFDGQKYLTNKIYITSETCPEKLTYIRERLHSYTVGVFKGHIVQPTDNIFDCFRTRLGTEKQLSLYSTFKLIKSQLEMFGTPEQNSLFNEVASQLQREQTKKEETKDKLYHSNIHKKLSKLSEEDMQRIKKEALATIEILNELLEEEAK